MSTAGVLEKLMNVDKEVDEGGGGGGGPAKLDDINCERPLICNRNVLLFPLSRGHVSRGCEINKKTIFSHTSGPVLEEIILSEDVFTTTIFISIIYDVIVTY